MNNQKFRLDGFIFGGLVVLVLIVGGYMVLQEVKKSQLPEDIGFNNKDRFGESSLLHVPDELKSYQKVKEVKTSFSQVWGLEVDESNKVYVSGDKGIRVYDENGKEIQYIETKHLVRYILLHGQKIYACIKNKVQIYNLEGELLNTWSDINEYGNFTAIQISKQYVFIGDSFNRKVWKLDLLGKVLGSFGTMEDDKKNGLNIPGPYLDLDLNSEGLLYVSNPGRHNVNAYDENGVLKLVTGHPSFKHDGFNGCCNPVAIHSLEGELITSEKGICRVKILSDEDQLLSIVAAPIDFKEKKHSLVIDIDVSKNNEIYTLVQGTQKYFIYKKIKGG